MSTLNKFFKSLNVGLSSRLTTPKKNPKYLKAGKEQAQYNKYKHNWQLTEAGILTLFWAIGLIAHRGGVYINLLLVLAAGFLFFALPYTYRQFNLRHHL